MSSTLLLDTVAWDIVLDASGNIAVANPPYQLAQDAASAIKLFLGELYYDTTQGVPYFQNILGQSPPIQYIKSKLAAAAMSADPNIVSAQVFISAINQRSLSGQVQVTDSLGETTAAAFSSGVPGAIGPPAVLTSESGILLTDESGILLTAR